MAEAAAEAESPLVAAEFSPAPARTLQPASAAREESGWTKLKLMLAARQKLADPTSTLVRKSVGVMMGVTLATRLNQSSWLKSSVPLKLGVVVFSCMAARVVVLFAFGSKLKKGLPTADVVAGNLTFAWSSYLFLIQVVQRFYFGCEEDKAFQCGYQNTLGCAVGASVILYILVNACDAIQDEYNETHNQFAAKFGKLCLLAAPLVLGWTWKDFMVAAQIGLEEKGEQSGRGLPETARMATTFGLLIWFFHMYSISARTARRRTNPEADSKYEQHLLDVQGGALLPLSFFDVSLLGDLLEFVDQTALQMMAWELKGVVGSLSVGQPDSIVVLVALCGVLVFALVQWVDKIANSPERWASASEMWKLVAKIHRLAAQSIPLTVGIGVSNVCLLIWKHALDVVFGPGEEFSVMQQTLQQQIYFLVIALIASIVLVVSDGGGEERTYHVVSLGRNNKVEGHVFSGLVHDAYRDASETFRAKRKAWQEGGEGAPVIARLYGTSGRVLDEFSGAGVQWTQLDSWCHQQLAHGEKYKPLVAQAYLVDNSALNSGAKGIGYRMSKDFHDIDGERTAHWNTVVHGVEAGGGWVLVDDRFLPLRVRDLAVLRRLEPREAVRLQQVSHAADHMDTDLDRVEFVDTDGDTVLFTKSGSGNIDCSVNGCVKVRCLTELVTDGSKLRMKGTPAGKWSGSWSMAPPDMRSADEAVALFGRRKHVQ